DVESNDVALAAYIEELQTEVKAIAGVTWYTPKVIATEQSRESTSYGFLATEDKIENVVLAENGLILLSYAARVKSSVASAGHAAIFLNANQIKEPFQAAGSQEANTSGTTERAIISSAGGLECLTPTTNAGLSSTGAILGSNEREAAWGGFTLLTAA